MWKLCGRSRVPEIVSENQASELNDPNMTFTYQGKNDVEHYTCIRRSCQLSYSSQCGLFYAQPLLSLRLNLDKCTELHPNDPKHYKVKCYPYNYVVEETY